MPDKKNLRPRVNQLNRQNLESYMDDGIDNCDDLYETGIINSNYVKPLHRVSLACLILCSTRSQPRTK